MLVETQYFPCLEFWAKARKNKEVIIEAHENYQKRSYRNKCNILSVNKMLTLSIPLTKGKHARMPIQEVHISEDDSWRNQHIQSVKSAYGNAPYFEYYWDDIKELIKNPSNLLYDYNMPILQYFGKILKVEIKESTAYIKTPTIIDQRQKILPKNKHLDWPVYDQVFSDRHDFVSNLSILDLLFCKGPETSLYIREISSLLP